MPIITGAILIASTPLVGLYSAIGIIKSPYNWKNYLPFYILTVFMLSHAFLPLREIDLTRYFLLADSLAQSDSFAKVLSNGDDGLFIRNIFLWAMAKFGDVHLIPAVSNSIVYGIAAYIAADTAEREEVCNFIPSIFLFQLIALPFYSITSNVRNVCTFSVIVLATYLDIIKKRKNIGILFLYILPCFLHQAGFIILALRILASIASKHRLPLLAVFLFSPTIIQLAYTFRGSLMFMGRTVQNGIVKIYNYWNTDSISDYESRILNSLSSQLIRLLMMALVFVLLAILLWLSKHNVRNEIDTFQAFSMLLCAMTLACWIFIAPHYWRFYSAAIIASPAVLIPALKKINAMPLLIRCGLYSLPLIAGLIFAKNLYNFITNADLQFYFEDVLLNDIYRVFLNCLIKNMF